MSPRRPYTPPLMPVRPARQTLATLLRYLWPPGRPDLRWRVVIALALLGLAKLTNVYVPYLFKLAVDALQKPDGATLIVVPVALVVAYGAARIGAQLFGELRDAIFATTAWHAVRTIALETFQHLHRLSLRFHLERQTGGLSRVIERGTKGIDSLLRFGTFSILPTLVEIGLVAAVLLWAYHYTLALTIVGTIVTYVVWTLVFTEWRTRFRREMNDRDTEANTKAVDSLLNYETVKYFGNEAWESRRYDASLARYTKAAVKSEETLSMLEVGQGVVISVGLVIVMILAGRGVADGSMTIGDFVMVNTYLIQLYLPLNFLGFAWREMRQGVTDMEQMFALMRQAPEVADRPDAIVLDQPRGEIRFENLDFAYDVRRPILRDVSLTVPAGHTLAIVGESGAGKSTIARLMYRFYDVSGGRLLIDGHDVRDLTQASVRAAIGVVPQDTVLFNDTIRYNVAYGRPDATDDEVREAARLAHIETFIASLPDGWNTMVGERGLKLSGGEKQRVAIARAILKDPRILIFDEATSALDTHTEKAIQANMREVSAGRTAIIVAHRLSTVVDADQIVVLAQGRVAETGRHHQLLAQDGLYAAMWRRQQEAQAAQERLAAVQSPVETPAAAE
jgi:ABC-type transport system involved in Fe-S cluster assembly fused permease/ATPase subunit